MFGHVCEISVYKQRKLIFQIHAATLPHPSETGHDGNLRQFNYFQESCNIYMMHELPYLGSSQTTPKKQKYSGKSCSAKWVGLIRL